MTTPMKTVRNALELALKHFRGEDTPKPSLAQAKKAAREAAESARDFKVDSG
ncbi:MAG: hypothetical protein GY953_39390 [bacterium]|nr:hypothetical protein [bacterium]